MKISEKDFNSAYAIIQKHLTATPLVKNRLLSKKYNCNVWLKLENLQPVGSFKLRGALNKMSSLTSEEKKKGVLAVSAGNHAQGVAWSAGVLGTPATIIMPVHSPMVKIKNTKELGAKVILAGENFDDSYRYAGEYLKNSTEILIHPFCDPFVIAGQGSIAFEILEQLPKPDFIFTAIGGGGLALGIGSVMKMKSPQTKIVGAQAQGANSMILSLRSKKVVMGNGVHTFADGIRVQNPNVEMFEGLKNCIDIAVDIPDEKIAASILELMESARVIAEGAGAITLASLQKMYEDDPKQLIGKDVVLVISGGNIDMNLIDRIICQGLMETSRRLHLKVILKDRPGSLNLLTTIISECGANILQVTHDRLVPHLDILSSLVDVQVEVKDSEHATILKQKIEEHFVIKGE